MNDFSYVKIFNCRISDINSDILTELIKNTIEKNKNLLITYTTFHSLNLLYQNISLQKIFSCFDVVHPDGIGVYYASFFGEGNRLSGRFSGSDFYPHLIGSAIKNKWRIFFFGDTNETLNKIKPFNNDLNVAGFESGFDYNEAELLKKINDSEPQILVVGLGCPKQEMWITENRDNIKVNIIIAVGDGIKVFAGIKKRGPVFVRLIGLEWVVRLFSNPGLYWKRYIIGIPRFISRIIRLKLTSLLRLN